MSIARYLEPHERHALLSELKNTRDRLFTILALNSGLRVGSVLSLRWKQLVWAGQPAAAIEVPRRHLKGGRGRRKKSVTTRRVPVNESVRAAIWDHMRAEFGNAEPPAEEWVFKSRKRWPGVISRQHAYAILTAAAVRAGLAPGVAPHSLRRSFAHDAFAASEFNLVKVQRLLGHANICTTAIYLKPDQKELDDIILGLPFRAAGTLPAEHDAGIPNRIFGT